MRLTVRVGDELGAVLEAVAFIHKRSLTKEIEWALEEYASRQPEVIDNKGVPRGTLGEKKIHEVQSVAP